MDLSTVLDELSCRASGFSINLNGRVSRTSGRSPLRGGTAGVHHGTLTPDGTEVAIKTFHCTHSGDADAFKRIFREVHIWSKLRHENVVRMLGISTEFDSTVSIISEWMSLGNAHNYVQSIENDPRTLLEDIAGGLCYLHNYLSPPGPIVHGDLKGANVLVSSDRRALLSDFGLSTVNISTFNMTVDALRGGSFHWMAPELLDDYPASKESDMWALGMTILELFTRLIPFHDCRSVGSVTCRVMAGKLPPRPVGESTQFRLSDAWWEICTSCWRRDPSSRPTIEDIIEKIKAAIHQASPTAMPPEAAAPGHSTSKETEGYPIPRETLVDEVVRRDTTTDQTLEGRAALETVIHDRASDTVVPEAYKPGTRRASKKSTIKGLRLLHIWGKAPVKLGFVPKTQPGILASSVPANPVVSRSTTENPIATHSTSDQDTVRSTGTPVPVHSPPTADKSPTADTLAPANREGLRPTTEDLIRGCPRFRVLVVGKSGIGKSTLINRIFGVSTANVAKDKPGEADIEQEFTSPENDRLILHDSKGFEAGDAGNYETVKSFIVRRKNEPKIKDQLHAVWLCFQIPIPTYGERLLEDAAEAFLKIRKEVLGNTPTIVVFTKHDRLVSFMRRKMPGDPEAGQRYLQEECVQLIKEFTGENIAHVAVSSKPKYEHELRDLISLTQDMVSMSFTSPENQVSPVPLAAAGSQRMLPTLKVQLSIAVGKQRYWRALASSANFQGYTMLNCLRVIHTDIVLVWNFYDLNDYLNSPEFLSLMMSMVETIDEATRSTAEPAPLGRSDTFSGNPIPLLTLAPVVLPFAACVIVVTWAYETYQRLQRAHQKFIAYIVALTHVLEILFLHTAEAKGKKLTRRAIKLAFKAYYESSWRRNVHADIRLFEGRIGAQDPILEKITFLISSADTEANVRAAIEGLPPFDSEVDEEWDDGQQGC